MNTEQTSKNIFMYMLKFSLVRGFDLVLFLGVTNPLISLVMGLSGPCILCEEWFGFGDLVRLF